MKHPCPHERNSVKILKKMLTLARRRKTWWVGADEPSVSLTTDYPLALCVSAGCTLNPQTASCPAKGKGIMYGAAAHTAGSPRRVRVKLEILCDKRKTFSHNHLPDKRRKGDLSQFPATLELHLKQPLHLLKLAATGTTAKLRVFTRKNFSLGDWMVSVKVAREEYDARYGRWVEVETPTEFSVVREPTA